MMGKFADHRPATNLRHYTVCEEFCKRGPNFLNIQHIFPKGVSLHCAMHISITFIYLEYTAVVYLGYDRHTNGSCHGGAGHAWEKVFDLKSLELQLYSVHPSTINYKAASTQRPYLTHETWG